MATDDQRHPQHPLRGAVRALHDDLGAALDRPLLTLGADDARGVLVDLAAVEARLDALRLRLLAHAEEVDVAAESGAASTAAWWSRATRRTRTGAAGEARLAAALDTRWTVLAAGLAAGEVNLEQAHVIDRALQALPDDLDPQLVTNAEKTLVGYATDFDAHDLRRLGRGILEVVAPDLVDEEEGKRLAAEERRARQRTRLTMTPDGQGAVHGRFTLPEAQAAMLRKALWALASPRHREAVETGADGDGTTPAGVPGLTRPTPERLGAAFGTLVEGLRASGLPATGGGDATVMVTMTLDQLLGRLDAAGVATLDTGDQVTAAQARRLACTHGLVPVVLGSKGEVLDAGRRVRFHTKAQRRLIALRDRHCTAEGCDWPPGMCEAHHDVGWATGGPTDVEHGRLVCPHHHRRLHDPAYAHDVGPDNRIRFHRRT